MNRNHWQVSDGYPAPELIARAHFAELARIRQERVEAEKRQILELEAIIQHQPNDFAD